MQSKHDGVKHFRRHFPIDSVVVCELDALLVFKYFLQETVYFILLLYAFVVILILAFVHAFLVRVNGRLTPLVRGI